MLQFNRTKSFGLATAFFLLVSAGQSMAGGLSLGSASGPVSSENPWPVELYLGPYNGTFVGVGAGNGGANAEVGQINSSGQVNAISAYTPLPKDVCLGMAGVNVLLDCQ